MAEESLIPSVLCMFGRLSQGGHTAQERVKRRRMVEPAPKKSSAKTISCLRNCWRCRSVLPVRGLHPACQPRIKPSVAGRAARLPGRTSPLPDRMHINVLGAWYYKAIYDATIAFCDLADKEIASWERTDGLGANQRTRDLLQQLLADN
jgi:hypothetical protein